MFKAISCISLLALLTACGHTDQVRVVTKEVYVVVQTPADMLKDCVAPRPIDLNMYSTLGKDFDRKEELMMDHTIDLYKTIQGCSADMEAVKQYQIKQVQNIRDKEAAANAAKGIKP